MTPTRDEITETGELLDYQTGSTWNDGGHWNTWIYKTPDGRFWQIHQETDYRSDVEITERERVVTFAVVYPKKGAS